MASLSDIAKKNNLNVEDFVFWVKYSKYSSDIKSNILTGLGLDDSKASAAVEDYRNELARKRAEAAEKEEKKRAMLVTSGFNFEGYKIAKYAGYVSGDETVRMGRGSVYFDAYIDNPHDDLMNFLANARKKAIDKLKENACALGCNAVIGISFDYVTVDPKTINMSGDKVYQAYVFGVVANGTAVVIEKIDD